MGAGAVGATAVGAATVGAAARTVVEGREFWNVKHLCFASAQALFEVVKLCLRKVLVD